MSSRPKNFGEAVAHFHGEALAEFRQRQIRQEQSIIQAKQVVGLPPSEWPALTFNWDTSTPSQCHSLDSTSPESFQALYPKGVTLGWVSLSDFDEKLCHFSRRDTLKELWGSGFKDKLAGMIVYLSRGGAISPPLLKPLKTGEVVLMGGNHRYAVAKAVGILEIPIYVAPEHQEAVAQIVPVRWHSAETLSETTSE